MKIFKSIKNLVKGRKNYPSTLILLQDLLDFAEEQAKRGCEEWCGCNGMEDYCMTNDPVLELTKDTIKDLWKDYENS